MSKSRTKVIFSSGYTADNVRQKRLPAESEFIAKPAPPREFLEKIREVLDGYKTMRPLAVIPVRYVMRVHRRGQC